MINRIPFLYLLAGMAMLLASCGSPLKQMTYMHDARLDEYYTRVPLPDPYRIKPNDQLYISVVSDDRQKTDFLNLATSTAVGGVGAGMDLLTYLVDENGKLVGYLDPKVKPLSDEVVMWVTKGKFEQSK